MEPFIGEIKMIPFNFAPRNWALCNGNLLAISTNQALFSLLTTYYGGNGVNNFALPDLRGRFAIGQAPGFNVGQMSGTSTATLSSQMMPAHTHAFMPASAGNSAQQVQNGWLAGFANGYAPPPDDPTKVLPISPNTIASAGQSQAHSNMQPWLCINFAVALAGIYPSRN